MTPTLERRDIKGDLHMHTTYSDGTDDLNKVAEAAIAMGYEYIAVTDHGEAPHVASHTQGTLMAQRAEIDALNAENAGRLSILQGVELDIGPSGELSEMGGSVHDLDLVIASIHSHFDLDPPAMTARVLKALSHPFVKILGHPTARRGKTRPPVQMDLRAVFGSAAGNGVALEINCTPTRLDLRDDHILLAREYGCRFVINTDSHSASGLPRVTLGVEVAQRAGVHPDEVVNCLCLEDLTAWLKNP